MNGRRILRQYAQSKGKEANEFVEVKPDYYSMDTLVTKDSRGSFENTTIDYKELFHMIVSNKFKNV